VVSRDAKRSSGFDCVHNQPNHFGRVRPAIYEIADEYGLASSAVTDLVPAIVLSDHVAKLAQQLDCLIKASVHVADDVERSALVLLVVPQGLATNRSFLDKFALECPGRARPASSGTRELAR
jgi:hypothetical protein